MFLTGSASINDDHSVWHKDYFYGGGDWLAPWSSTEVDPQPTPGHYGMMATYMCHLRTLGLIFLFLGSSNGYAREIPQWHMSIRNIHTNKRLERIKVIEQDPAKPFRQWVNPEARRQLSTLFRDWRTKRSKHMPERLIWYLYLVGQHFDKPIDLVSVYRHDDQQSSRHKQGRAADFKIRGVDPKVVWEYCKRFRNIGLGYYPNSGFIHLDVRKKSYYWIDDSGPGEDARYRKNIPQEWKEKAEKRKRAKRRMTKKNIPESGEE